jgi:transposase
MKRFVQGDNRTQTILLPEALDDYVTDTNPVRVVDVFVDELNLQKLGFEGVEPALTGRPSYHPEVMLKIYIYGYLNRIQSSRRLEREAQRNIELMWLTAAWHRTLRPLRGFAKTTAKRSAASVVSSLCCVNA